MELKTRGWGEVILATLPSLDPIERLRAIRELVWREEILLIPRYSDVETAIQDTLSPIDCRERKIKGATVFNVDWISIRDDYLNIAVTMVTAARFRFNLVAFEEAIQALEEFHDEDQEIRHRIRHEKCLWVIYNGDFNSLRELLSDWKQNILTQSGRFANQQCTWRLANKPKPKNSYTVPSTQSGQCL